VSNVVDFGVKSGVGPGRRGRGPARCKVEHTAAALGVGVEIGAGHCGEVGLRGG
jgi:hypothetical protein